MRILVVDDSEDARDIMAATLASGGYEDIIYAESGAEALSKLAVGGNSAIEPVDVILLDILMPGMDGIETCASIRADTRYRDVPILMVTSISDVNSLSQAFVAGANDYVTKPFNRIELLARIRSAMKLKGELDRRQAREDELTKLTSAASTRDSVAGGGARIDRVSGLPDYQAIDALILSGGNNGSLGVVAFRVDGQSRFASTRGKVGEDNLIRRVGQALSYLPSRLGDLLGLYDEDLFVAVLPGASAESLRALAEHARRQISDLRIAHPDSSVSPYVTLSIGAALRDVEDANPRSTLADAIAALECAAKRGDNVEFTWDVETV